MIDCYKYTKPLLFKLPPEAAHHVVAFVLQRGWLPALRNVADARLGTTLCGLAFDSPIGLAAGFDKDATMFGSLYAHGFGHIEVGTITPKAQRGNPRPRMFRLESERAIINRLGFNNHGAERALEQVIVNSYQRAGILGINIGKNRDTDNDNALDDYLLLLRASYELADYITINISSPNTAGLRELQQRDYIDGFLKSIMQERNGIAAYRGYKRPIFLKISPDMQEDDLSALLESAVCYQVDGLIVSNTTIDRPASDHPRIKETGGLSGAPLTTKACSTLKHVYKQTSGNMPIIGVGGIMNGQDAVARIRAGATLVQLYSGLIYRGFALVQECKRALIAECEKEEVASVQDLIGIDNP